MFYDSNKLQMHFFSPIKLKTNNNCCEGCSRKYNGQVFQTHFSAGVAKLVDAVDSKSTAFGCAGSSPAFGTKNQTLRASFFMPKIYGLWGVTLPLSLPRYTKTNSHQVSAVACCGYKRFGIFRFDNSLYQRLKMLALGVYPDISLAEAREKVNC